MKLLNRRSIVLLIPVICCCNIISLFMQSWLTNLAIQNNRIIFANEVAFLRQQLLQQSQQSISTTATTIHFRGIQEVMDLVRLWFDGRDNAFCSAIKQLRYALKDPNLFMIVNITFGCQDLFANGYFGTGNYIAFFYGLRLSAHALGNVDLYITCDDAESTKRELILPWIMGYFPARLSHQKSKYTITNETACGTMHSLPLAHMHQEMQYELRRMAIALVGIPSSQSSVLSSSHANQLYAQQYAWSSPQDRRLNNDHPTSPQYTDNTDSKSVLLLPPFQPNDKPLYTSSQFQPDDVTIHFRCGDFMADQWDWIETSTFQCYVRHIPNNVTSIGILTQPFQFKESGQQRKDDADQKVMGRCKVLVHSFIAYIQHHHPNVRIRVHNSIRETITLTYARMIMAHQSITGMTSFGEFATLATFGTGYIRSPSQWLKQVDQLTDNVILYEPDKVVTFRHIKQLWNENGTETALKWFWNGAIPHDHNYFGH